MKTTEFEQDLAIDPNQLDVMAAQQGELFFKWAEKASRAKAEVDEAKFRLEVTVAKLGNRARIDPGSFGMTKTTEGAIDTAVKMSVEYQEAYEELIKAKSESALFDKAVDAMEQKKRMIEVLVTLHGQQYFAGPSVPRNLSEAWQDAQEKRSAKIMEKTKIRRRKEKSDG